MFGKQTMRAAESAITLSSDLAPREISGNFPGKVGRQLFKIGDRLPPVTFGCRSVLYNSGVQFSPELRMAAKPIERIGGRVAVSGHQRMSMRL